MGGILGHQLGHGSNLSFSSGLPAFLSNLLAFLVAIFCMQAKLGLVPFDASEAEQEIMGGILIEYSGLPLAIFKLNKAVLLYTMPLFLIILFWAGNLTPVSLIWKYLVLLVVIILIKNTNPRMRIDQTMRFFWGPMTVIALLAVGLALLGK
jgi:NADH-quinone oxidoreductase subunit H